MAAYYAERESVMSRKITRKNTKPLPSQKELLRLFRYDAETGRIFWRVKCCRMMPVGAEAGWYGTRNYRLVSICRSKYQVHRIVWKMHKGYDPVEIDHWDGVHDNNRIDNLRNATSTENHCNQLVIARKSGVGLKGAYKPRNRDFWVAQIKYKGTHHYLGSYATEELAHAVYVAKAIELHGEWANDGRGSCL